MKKIFILVLSIFIFGDKVFSALDRSTNLFDINITQAEIPPGGNENEKTDGGLSTGGIVGIAVGVGGPAGGAGGSVAAAPLILAGLSPNSPVSAAVPIVCFKNIQYFLKTAITQHFCEHDYINAKIIMDNLTLSDSSSFYLAKNDSAIKNGTFDINTLRIPRELLNAQNIKINITIASEPYKEIDLKPELALGIYKNINSADLKRKFETQQFLHNYLMKKYEIPLKITSKNYANGIQKISGVLNLSQLKNKTAPLYIVTRYTYNGFQANRNMILPKTLIYAYLVEFKK